MKNRKEKRLVKITHFLPSRSPRLLPNQTYFTMKQTAGFVGKNLLSTEWIRFNDQLKKFDVKSGLFQQLHYNYNYRLKNALQDHNYAKDCWYDEQVLKPNFSVNNSDVWHAPLLLDNNITEDLNNEDHQLVTVMLAPAEDQYVPSAPTTKNQTMYEHETVNVYVNQLEGIVEAAKGNLVSEEGENTQEKGTTKENQFELFISVSPMEEVNPFGFNYHDIKQNTQV